MSVFQDLYDSEINFSISTMWDGGFQVKLGDEMNGFVAEATFRRFGSVEGWLINMACVHFSDSGFVKRYADELPESVIVANIDRGRETRERVLYMARDVAKTDDVGGVIDAAETLAAYILTGKKPGEG